jgi:hypothetical protein
MSDADDRAESAELLVDGYVAHTRKPGRKSDVELLADILEKTHSPRIVAEIAAAAILRLTTLP